jgi:SAM-dependent methyltransferase
MASDPQTWHYGLVAKWWAQSAGPRPEELAYYRSVIERYGSPALDLCCGTGRLLLPLLESGLDMDGCDLSPDMLAVCREHATSRALEPRLYAQAMHTLKLPRTYGTIYICDSFGIGGHRHQDEEALRRCYHHLDPGGALVFSVHLPYGDRDQWSWWLPEQRRQLPEEWPSEGRRRAAANGDEYEWQSRLAAFNPLEQRETLQVRVTLRRGGQVVTQEEHELRSIVYFRNEVLLLLRQAGFGVITVRGGYTDELPTPDDTILVFIAEKDR